MNIIFKEKLSLSETTIARSCSLGATLLTTLLFFTWLLVTFSIEIYPESTTPFVISNFVVFVLWMGLSTLHYWFFISLALSVLTLTFQILIKPRHSKTNVRVHVVKIFATTLFLTTCYWILACISFLSLIFGLGVITSIL